MPEPGELPQCLTGRGNTKSRHHTAEVDLKDLYSLLITFYSPPFSEVNFFIRDMYRPSGVLDALVGTAWQAVQSNSI
jgi:hypothetical protein